MFEKYPCDVLLNFLYYVFLFFPYDLIYIFIIFIYVMYIFIYYVYYNTNFINLKLEYCSTKPRILFYDVL